MTFWGQKWCIQRAFWLNVLICPYSWPYYPFWSCTATYGNWHSSSFCFEPCVTVIYLQDIVTFDLSERGSSFQNVPFSAVREACPSNLSIPALLGCIWSLSFQNVCSCSLLSFNTMCFPPINNMKGDVLQKSKLPVSSCWNIHLCLFLHQMSESLNFT